MSHKGIRKLIEDTAKSLGDDIQFTYGRTSDFNKIRDKRYPFITLDLLIAAPVYSVNNVSNYVKSWDVNMGFYEIDKEDSAQDQYAKILDDMDTMVDQFINKLNTYAYGQNIDSDALLITNMNQLPFVKATADILTGYLFTFRIQVSDQFNYCGLDC